MAVGKKLRFDVFKRDSFTCMYCGRTPPQITLEVDHVHPRSQGGSDEIDNLLASCFDCNRGKRDGQINEKPIAGVDLKQKLEGQQERADQLRAYNQFMMEQRSESERMALVVSDKWMSFIGKDHKKWMLSEDKTVSVRMFLTKLSLAEVLDALDIAIGNVGLHSNNVVWKYFCGVCWNKIKRNNGGHASHG